MYCGNQENKELRDVSAAGGLWETRLSMWDPKYAIVRTLDFF